VSVSTWLCKIGSSNVGKAAGAAGNFEGGGAPIHTSSSCEGGSVQPSHSM